MTRSRLPPGNERTRRRAERIVSESGTPTDPTDDQVLDFQVVKGEITDACPEILASIS
jgi:hypothetical protein